MEESSGFDPLRRFVREHERGLIVAWLATLALVLGVGFVWGIRFRGLERVVDAWDARWPAKVDAGATLFGSRHFAEAAALLERADADFPARSVKHRLDREREHLLQMLAQCYVELDKKRRALETCERLVAFDPRNWQNHATQARTALAFSDSELAKQALDRLLAIHPTHLPSVEARIKLEFDAGAFARVPPLWRAYLEAYRLATIEFTFGDVKALLEVPSDGLAHRFEVPFELPAAAFKGEARFATKGWSIDVRDVAFCPAPRIGVAGVPQFASIAAGAWTVGDADEVGPGRISARNAKSSLRRELESSGIARGAFDVVAYKACTASLWQMVETSYSNLLMWDELEAVRARTRTGGCLEGGSLFED